MTTQASCFCSNGFIHFEGSISVHGMVHASYHLSRCRDANPTDAVTCRPSKNTHLNKSLFTFPQWTTHHWIWKTPQYLPMCAFASNDVVLVKKKETAQATTSTTCIQAIFQVRQMQKVSTSKKEEPLEPHRVTLALKVSIYINILHPCMVYH